MALTLQLARLPFTLKLVLSPPQIQESQVSFPHATLSCFLRPVHPFGYPPVSAFCTQSLDGKWKIPSSLVLPSWLQGLIQGSP